MNFKIDGWVVSVARKVRLHHSKIWMVILAGLANFLFQLYTARKLSIMGYGEFAAVWTAIATLSWFTTGFQNHAAIEVSKVKSDNVLRQSFYLASAMKASGAFCFIFLLVVVFLQDGSTAKWRIFLIALSFPISTFTSIVLGRALGSTNPTSYYKGNFWLSFAKFVSAVIFLTKSKNPLALILFLMLTHILLMVIWFIYQDRKLAKIIGHFWDFESRLILVTSAIYWSLAGLDVVIFRFHADGLLSGSYSALSALAKIPRVLSTAASAYRLSRTNELDERQSMRSIYFRNTVYLCYCLVFLAIVVAFFAGDEITRLTIGQKYSTPFLLTKQIASYSGLMILGIVLSFRYHTLKVKETYIVCFFGVVELVILAFARLTTNQFLSVVWIFPTLIAFYLGRRISDSLRTS